MTTIRSTTVTLPAAPFGPDNPLPRLTPLPEAPWDERERGPYPVRGRDGYERARALQDLAALVVENDRLTATVLPGLGGRIASLVHRPTGRELLYRNPVLQPAGLGPDGVWCAGGLVWDLGTASCAPVHAARVTAPDGGPMLRLWEWERLQGVPFQVDLWLPDGSDFLYAAVRVRNPHEKPVQLNWWSRAAIPDDHTVLAPAEEIRLSAGPQPQTAVVPRQLPCAENAFYGFAGDRRRWVAALGADGRGLAQTSTDGLPGRTLFTWGNGRGGRRWQEWLTGPDAAGHAELRAGPARTPGERVRLAAESEMTWLEAYGPLESLLDDGMLGAEERLATALPRAVVDAAYAAWKPYADSEPVETLAVGSGWGALEVLRADWKLPGTPFPESTLGELQEPWRELLRTGTLPEPRRVRPPGETLVAPHWRDLLENAPAAPCAEYHLGVAQWHAGDRAQAVRSWERALQLAPSVWPLLRCLAVADREGGHRERAADRYAEAFDDLCRERRDSGEAWTAATAALGREAIAALLAVRRIAVARAVWERLLPATRARGRFRLLEAELLLAEGRRAAARAVLVEGVEVADLRVGDDVLEWLWERCGEGELPERYDFRVR